MEKRIDGYKIKLILVFLGLLLCGLSFGQSTQTGMGTQTVADGVSIQLESPDKGLLIPAVALTNRKQTTPLPSNIPMGTTVFNTNTFGSFPEEVNVGFYYWDDVESEWKPVAENDSNASAKFHNSNSNVDLYNTTVTQVNLMGNQVYNENPDIITRLDQNQIQFGASGVYEITVNLAFRQNSGTSGARGMNVTLRLDGNPVGTAHYLRVQHSVGDDGKRNSASFTEFLQINEGQILTLTSVRATTKSAVINLESGLGTQSSSITIKRIR